MFCVVDNDHVSDGVQVTIEPAGLGDAVKDVFAARKKSKGVTAGNYAVNPYAINWEHNEKAADFGDRYKATAMDFPLTPEVSALIRGPIPDTSRYTRHFNVRTMRATLERHCLIKGLPWDWIFQVPAWATSRRPDYVGRPLRLQALATAIASAAPKARPRRHR